MPENEFYILGSIYFMHCSKIYGKICVFHATETYITHFLEGARFPKSPVLAGCKVLYAPECQLTVRLTA